MKTTVSHMDTEGFPAWVKGAQRPFHAGYYAMYSSIYDAIVTDPALMLIPVDDHIVHRGDGAFDTLKCVNGNLYNLPAHMTRLMKTVGRIDLTPPFDTKRLQELITQTVRAGKHRDCLVRVLISRGPGSLGVNPYDCPASQVYIIAAALKPPFMQTHPEGARVQISSIPAKQSFFATVKSCNYLPNVLMKKEAVDKGVDFVISLDTNGNLAEGATENVAIISADGVLKTPCAEHILAGTTMRRIVELAEALVQSSTLRGIECCPLSQEDLMNASEVLILGTTPDVTAVVEMDKQAVGNGKPGPVQEKLNQLLTDDILNNSARHTPVF